MLIVEDDALARATLIGMLCKEFDCSYVDDGLEAIRYCQKHETPNVILMDYHMPEVNGVDACIKLRECSRSKDIPIIFLPQTKIVSYKNSVGLLVRQTLLLNQLKPMS